MFFFFSFHRHVLYDPLSVNLGLLGFFKKMRVEPIKHQCIPSWLPFCIHNLAVLHQWWFKTTIGMILFFFFFGSRRQVKRAAFLILLFQAFEFILSFHPFVNSHLSFVVRHSTIDNRHSSLPSPHTRKPVETAINPHQSIHRCSPRSQKVQNALKINYGVMFLLSHVNIPTD